MAGEKRFTSNNKKVLLFMEEEDEFGEALESYATPEAILSFANSTMKPVNEAIDVSLKTNTNQPTLCEKLAGREKGALTISGEVAESNLGSFMKLITHDTTSPLTVTGTKDVKTFQIVEVFSDGTDELINFAFGCRLDSIKIAGSGNGMLTYDLAITSLTPALMQTTTQLPNLPEYADIVVPCADTAFTDVAFSSLAEVNNFDFTITDNYASDDVAFLNSNTKSAEYFIGMTGEFNYTRIYNCGNVVENTDLYKAVLIPETITIGTDTLLINYRITDSDSPDQGKDIMIETVKCELVSDASNESVTYTIV